MQSFEPPYLHTKKAATKGHNPVLYLVDRRSLTGSAGYAGLDIPWHYYKVKFCFV